MGLLDTFIQSVKDLNPEWTKDRLKTAGGLLADFTPVVGDVKAGYDMVDAARQGNYGEAALNGLGLLPFVPAMGGIVLKHGTTAEKAAKIRNEGLKAIDNADSRPLWFTLVDNEDGAKIFGDTVLNVDIPDALKKQYIWGGKESSYGTQYAIKKDLPKDFIK